VKLQVLGTGCAKCRKLYHAVEEAISELELTDCTLEKVEKIADIAAMGVMLTPALAVDGKVVVSGRVPSAGEIRELISH